MKKHPVASWLKLECLQGSTRPFVIPSYLSHLLPATVPSFTHLQFHTLLFQNLSSTLLPQGLCTYSFFNLKYLKIHVAYSKLYSGFCLNVAASGSLSDQNSTSLLFVFLIVFIFLHCMHHQVTLYIFMYLHGLSALLCYNLF